MKRLLMIVTLLGTLSAVGIAEAGHHHHRRHARFHDPHCGPHHVAAYRYPVYRPAIVYPQPTVVYSPYVVPSNNLYFQGRNFGVQFGW